MKALDIERFSIEDLLFVISSFQYETIVLEQCNDRKLSRIVRLIESGKVERDGQMIPVMREIPYLIFELGAGDIRATVDIAKPVSQVWQFHILHQAAAALLQLHTNNIAHQDLKPSNLLRFHDNELKIGDLGRSSRRGSPAPHDELRFLGAINYAPFEQRYDYRLADWAERRFAVDLFHLGCLIVFVFTNVCFPEFVMSKVAAGYRPDQWGDPYPEVLAHLQHANVIAFAELAGEFPERHRDELTRAVLDLCNPDPNVRGASGTTGRGASHTLRLQRYVSRFDLLKHASQIRA